MAERNIPPTSAGGAHCPAQIPTRLTQPPASSPVPFAVTQGGWCQWESVKGDRRYVALGTAVGSAPQANSPVLLEVSFACIPHLLFSAT